MRSQNILPVLMLSVFCLSLVGCPSTPTVLKAGFSTNVTSGDFPLTVQFHDDSTTAGTPILSWAWDFDDGGASTLQNPSHVFMSPGIYSISLTVTDAAGSATVTKQNYITVEDPEADLYANLGAATVVVRDLLGAPKAEHTAAIVLVEEIEKRTGITLSQSTAWPAQGPVIALTSGTTVPAQWGHTPPASTNALHPETNAEGYRVVVDTSNATAPVVWILGADGRGALYGVGKFLRSMRWAQGQLRLAVPMDFASSPAYPIRGHQIGYTNTNNSCDAWSVAQYEQYIRELVLFGANSVENAPLDTSTSAHFQIARQEMAASISEICDRYDVDYWVWTAAGDLSNAATRQDLLTQHATLYRDCVRLNGVFVPGGDPGSNPVSLLMPFLQDLNTQLSFLHPDAGLWVSNQGFTPEQNDEFFNYLTTQHPDWLKGVVFGPWTKISLAEERTRTPEKYLLRHYPDITHNVRCQYPVPNWDRALALTHNREGSNPRPLDTAHIHNLMAPYTDGFIAYSEGSHDDVNKMIWSARGWDPDVAVSDVLQDYARFFFRTTLSEQAASAILALEQNWKGALAENVGVDTTYTQWTQLEQQAPDLASNWRWQFCLLRAKYDKYIKDRLLNEKSLETTAVSILASSQSIGSEGAINLALATLATPDTLPVDTALRSEIVALCQSLFDAIGYQSSLSLYQASGYERSCVLDFVDYPVNNRYWIEDMCAAARLLGTEDLKNQKLNEIVTWESSGIGGFYDDLGNGTKEPHLVPQMTWEQDPGYVASPQDEFAWLGSPFKLATGSNLRLSVLDQGQTLFGAPLQMTYTGLAPAARYRVKVMYAGRFNGTTELTANGVIIRAEIGATNPPASVTFDTLIAPTADGKINLNWDLITGRGCQVAEVWLLKVS